MKFRLAFVSTLALLAATAPAAAGSLLVTLPVRANTADVHCMVNHLGDDNTAAIGRLYQGAAVLVDGGSPYPVYPGVNSVAGQTNVTGFFYCVFEGLTKEMRGYIMLSDGDQSVIVLPATR